MVSETASIVVSKEGRNLRTALEREAPTILVSRPGALYILDKDGNVAPENITIRREGEDLRVLLAGDSEADLILEGYFSEDPPAGLFGVAEDGQLYAYVRTDGGDETFSLDDGQTVSHALGGEPQGDGAPYFEHSDEPVGGDFPWGELLLGGLSAAALAYVAYDYANDEASPGPGTIPEPAVPDVPAGPDAPQVTVTDDRGSELASGSSTNDSTPTFSGRAAPGSTVIVRDKTTGEVIATTAADANGDFRVTSETPLGDGPHAFESTVQDAAGSTSPSSDPILVTIDTVAPGSPLIDGATDDVGAQQGPLLSGSSTDDSTPTLSGRAEAGNRVIVDDNGLPVGSTLVEPDGTWRLVPEAPLANGLHQLTAIQVDAAGNASAPSAPIAFVTIDGATPGTVQIFAVSDDQGYLQGNVATGGTTDDNRPSIIGSADPGSSVQVRGNGPSGVGTLGSVTADANGAWMIPVQQALADGDYEFVAVSTTANGATVNSDVYNVDVDTRAVVVSGHAIDLASASDDGASSIDNITSVQDPVVSGSVGGLNAEDLAAVRAGTVTATLFDDVNDDGVLDRGDTLLATGITLQAAGSNGASFSRQLSNLAEGSYNVKSVLLDAAGNQSTPGLLDGDPAAQLVIGTGTAGPATGTRAGTGADSYGGLGWSTQSAGDFNGDGIEDFIVSAPYNQWGFNYGIDNSKVYIVYGTEDGLPKLGNMDALTAQQGVKLNNTDVSINEGNLDIRKTGIVLRSLGDINGDGYDDVIIGSNREDGAYVVFGRATGTDTINLREMMDGATSNGFRVGWGGAWMAAAADGGDFNNDGYADIVISDAADYRLFVIYGQAGAAGTGAWTNLAVDSNGVYETLVGIPGQKLDNATVIRSAGNGPGTGENLANVGDVNGDGVDDFVFTTTYANVAEAGQVKPAAGVAYLLFGGTTLPSAFTIDQDYANYGIKLSGTENWERLGDANLNWPSPAHGGAEYAATGNVSTLGDINGDGIDDFIIGSPVWGDNADDGVAAGRAYVLYGKASGWSDISLSQLDGSNGFYLASSALGTDATLGSGVAGGGDVNGDGLDDFLIGAPAADTNGLTDNGAVYLVFGQAGTPFAGSPSVDIDRLVAEGKAIRWTGAASEDQMGTNSGMGDWNNDGLADVAIASWKGDYDGLTNNGQYTIYYGGSPDLAPPLTRAGASGGQAIAAGEAADGTDATAAMLFDGADLTVDLSVADSAADKPSGSAASTADATAAATATGLVFGTFANAGSALVVEQESSTAIL